MSETPVQTLAGIVLRLSERVEQLERRLDAHDAKHASDEEQAYYENMEAAEYGD